MIGGSFMVEADPIQTLLVAARRKQILDAATQVFAEKGFHRATVHDVAKAAGIASGTIYTYFDNKTGLLLGILDRLNQTQQRAEDFEQAAKDDFQGWVRDYIRQRYAAVAQQGYEVFQVLLSELLVDKELRRLYFQQIVKPTYELAERFFQEWQAGGAIQPVDPALATRVIAGAFLGSIILRLMDDIELQAKWDELPDVVAEIILNGLVPRESHE
jgi:AcrR family transcriptional regulator